MDHSRMMTTGVFLIDWDPGNEVANYVSPSARASPDHNLGK